MPDAEAVPDDGAVPDAEAVPDDEAVPDEAVIEIPDAWRGAVRPRRSGMAAWGYRFDDEERAALIAASNERIDLARAIVNNPASDTQGT